MLGEHLLAGKPAASQGGGRPGPHLRLGMELSWQADGAAGDSRQAAGDSRVDGHLPGLLGLELCLLVKFEPRRLMK